MNWVYWLRSPAKCMTKKTDKSYTEVKLNQFSDSELPEKFSGMEYQVLLVAEKYQTGFDEPLLHTMFVDKPLKGVKAVQTLSRLNRTTQGKTDTFVLDFANTAEDIQEAFKPFYEATEISETTDANVIYDLKVKLDEYRIYWSSEIDNFAEVFFTKAQKQGNIDFGILNSYLDPAVDRYKAKEEDEQDEFKSTLAKFIRTYSFITNIVRLEDVELHKFFAYAKCLIRKLPRELADPLLLDDEVELQYYRLQKIYEGDILLQQGDPLPNDKHAGLQKKEEEKEPLSALIDKLNERFGTEWKEGERLLMEQFVSAMVQDENLRTQAQNNSREHFMYPFKDAFEGIVVDRMTQNKEVCEKILDDQKFSNMVIQALVGYVYDKLRAVN